MQSFGRQTLTRGSVRLSSSCDSALFRFNPGGGDGLGDVSGELRDEGLEEEEDEKVGKEFNKLSEVQGGVLEVCRRSVFSSHAMAVR